MTTACHQRFSAPSLELVCYEKQADARPCFVMPLGVGLKYESVKSSKWGKRELAFALQAMRSDLVRETRVAHSSARN